MYFYHGAPDWFFSAMAFIGFVLSFIPLPWHLEAWNVGTCLYMIWTGLACLVLFINSIVWHNNVIDWSPTWCDISTHFMNGFNLAIPATSLCINRRLYQIASVRSVTRTHAEKRRAIIIDLLIGLGLPILQIPLQYIVQGHRYNIFEDIGCLGTTYETPVAVVLFHMPPIIIGSISAVYCVLSIRAFYASHLQFKELLSSSNTNLNINRYFRLMALASVDLIFTIPLGIWVLYNNVAVVGLSPWISWEDTHSNFSRVVQVPGIFWRSDPLTAASLETLRWATIFCAFVFFGFFGFADEAMKNYKTVVNSVARKVGLSTAGSTTLGGSSGVLSSNGTASKSRGNGPTLPVFIRKETSRKRDSLDSFSSAGLDSLSYIDKEKSFAGTESFAGALDKSFGAIDEPSGSGSASLAGDSDAEEIEVSSLHRASVFLPQTTASAPTHSAKPDVPIPANDIGGGRGGGVFNPGPANIDARVANDSDKQLVASRAGITVAPNDLPLRPDFGTAGRAIKLRANFFPVRLPSGPLYEYDVAITPVAGTAVRRVKKRIFQLAEQSQQWAPLTNRVVHDSSAKIIAVNQLPQPLQIRVPYYDADETPPAPTDKKYKEYTLKITFTQSLDMQALQQYVSGNFQYRDYDIMPLISAMNLLLASHANRTGVQVGRNRFFVPSPGRASDLGGGLEAFRGFYSSVRPAHNQLMVNLNVCTTAFYKPGNLARAMIEFRDSTFGARPEAFVRGVRVKTTHLGYKKTVKKLSNKTAKSHIFACAEFNNEKVSVETYFKRRYNITLREPNMPLVDVGGAKQNLLPAEVCEILPGQAFKGKLTDDHTAAMIRVAAQPPAVNAAAITGPGLDQLGFRQGGGALQQFGVSIGQEMAVVPGRILTPPRVVYGQGTPSVDDRASWNLRDVKFKVGATLDKWIVLLIRDGGRDEFQGPNDPELIRTMQGFVKMCNTSGMKASPPSAFKEAILPQKNSADPTRAQAIPVIRTAINTVASKPKLVFVILSNGDKHVYSGLKHLCDSYMDIGSICVHAAKIRKDKGQLQYFANVALKVNMKMGGVNHGLDPQNMAWLKQEPTMLVGIDVTHPGPGSVHGTPSIAAVVASVDQHYAQYPASMEIQESRKEMVTNLKGMMLQRLRRFASMNGNRLPSRVLVYRDGVSEGQFRTVIEEELPEIKAAFRETPVANYNPKLTIVICGKRHHTRFYPAEQNDAAGDGNPKAGTVVDRGVTAVYEFDFFLQAHGGLQGTTRPTHYYVVHDEIGFTADLLQGLTNSVSYMFARATKAVSLVSPAYYADLACERGRCYLHKLLNGITSSASTTTSNSTQDEAVMQEAAAAWHGGVAGVQLKETMYYL
ncbi:Argonaute-like protein [Mycena indigotica]|uniref:Argonaute-like protein n=1 Tax=Mycena indigotica TaxID=2126181 RepID=A0A8H6S832_9AGAR|nr:Argonaute-like protein [Mycena indigotica]KAF7293020.1 Argonaute-like protein [Mycena indigotica]